MRLLLGRPASLLSPRCLCPSSLLGCLGRVRASRTYAEPFEAGEAAACPTLVLLVQGTLSSWGAPSWPVLWAGRWGEASKAKLPSSLFAWSLSGFCVRVLPKLKWTPGPAQTALLVDTWLSVDFGEETEARVFDATILLISLHTINVGMILNPILTDTKSF